MSYTSEPLIGPMPHRELYNKLLLGERVVLQIPELPKAFRLRSLLSTLHSRTRNEMKKYGESLDSSLIMRKLPDTLDHFEIYLGKAEPKPTPKPAWTIIEVTEAPTN